ncbi:MAG: hypothetical protein U0237_19860 [Thermoleophilia bacterium]
MEHRVEVLLKVDALRQAVRGDEDPLVVVGELQHPLLRSAGGSRPVTASTCTPRSAAEDSATYSAVGMNRQNRGPVAVGDELLDERDRALEFGVALPAQGVGLAGHLEEAPSVAGVLVLGQLGVGSRRRVEGVHLLVVAEIHDGAAAEGVGLGVILRDDRGTPVPERRGGSGRAGPEGAQQAEGRPPAHALTIATAAPVSVTASRA